MEIIIENSMVNASIKIWMQEHKDSGNNINYSFNNDGKLLETEWEGCSTSELKPLLELPRKTFVILTEAIVKYNTEKGVYTEREDITKGRLIEKENHLGDMKTCNEKLFKLLESAIEKI